MFPTLDTCLCVPSSATGRSNCFPTCLVGSRQYSSWSGRREDSLPLGMAQDSQTFRHSHTMALQIQSCHLFNVLEINSHPSAHFPCHRVEFIFKASGFFSAISPRLTVDFHLQQISKLNPWSLSLGSQVTVQPPHPHPDPHTHSHSSQAPVSKGRFREGNERPSACLWTAGGWIN